MSPVTPKHSKVKTVNISVQVEVSAENHKKCATWEVRNKYPFKVAVFFTGTKVHIGNNYLRNIVVFQI